MSLFDNPFGGLFDFNRDGHTDMFEAGLGFAIMQDLFENDEEEIKGDGGACIGELEDLQTQLDELNDMAIHKSDVDKRNTILSDRIVAYYAREKQNLVG